MTREKIIEKFKENAEKIPNKWGEVCWVFIDENFEEIADELLELIEQEKKIEINKVKATDVIKKDLEVLEILKKYLKNKSLELGIEDIIICCENEEDYNKIKEWLENDKRRDN